MQEQNSQEKPKNRVRFTIWGVLGYGLILLAAIGILVFYTWMPMHVDRDLSDKLPWTNEGLVIEEVEASWKSSQGNAHLSKRTALYPEADIRINAAPGKGRIDVIFLDPMGTQIGDTHYLRYENGQFEKNQNRVCQSEGNTATVWLETGFESMDLFTLHLANREENLWRVVCIHRPEGASEGIRLGQRSIKAEIKSTEKGE